MAEAEGTIHFAYELTAPDAPPCDPDLLATLNAWRTVLRRLGVVGQDPDRYDGYGFGNISFRDPTDPGRFVITASQTGGQAELTDAHLALITRCDPDRFWVDAVGHEPPSSETLTHGMFYRGDPSVGWVLHGHCPDIWRRHEALGLPCTGEDVAYGSLAMGQAVAGILDDAASSETAGTLALVTLGHEDGVFVCGPTADQTGGRFVALLARALGSPEIAA